MYKKKSRNTRTSLAVSHPFLIKEWHPTKNGELTPYDAASKSGKKVWWLCQRDHEWIARIADRTSGKGCPTCYNLRRGKKK